MRHSYRANAARAPLCAGSLLLAGWLLAACAPDPVDPALVGTWEIPGPGGSWQLSIDGAGHYAFTNGGVGTAPAHDGTFAARDGQWSLRAAAGGVEDSGTYELVAGALQLTGNRGALRWGRAAAPAPVEPTDALGAAAGAVAVPAAASNLPSGVAPLPATVQTAAPVGVRPAGTATAASGGPLRCRRPSTRACS